MQRLFQHFHGLMTSLIRDNIKTFPCHEISKIFCVLFWTFGWLNVTSFPSLPSFPPPPRHLTESNISLCKWMYFDILIRMNCIWIAISFSDSMEFAKISSYWNVRPTKLNSRGICTKHWLNDVKDVKMSKISENRAQRTTMKILKCTCFASKVQWLHEVNTEVKVFHLRW